MACLPTKRAFSTPYTVIWLMRKLIHREGQWLAQHCTALAEPWVEASLNGSTIVIDILFYPKLMDTYVQIFKSGARSKTWVRLKWWGNELDCTVQVCMTVLEVKYSSDRPENTPLFFLSPKSYIIRAQRIVLISCSLIWLGTLDICTLPRPPLWQNSECPACLWFACWQLSYPEGRESDSGFVILCLILTNRDRLLLELKLSGTQEKVAMSASCLRVGKTLA